MAEANSGLRENYQPDPRLADKLMDPNYDEQSNPGYFIRYRQWIDDGRPSKHEELATYFGGFQRPRTALSLGDRRIHGEKAAGQVRINNADRDDFSILEDFVNAAPATIPKEKLVNAGLGNIEAIQNPTDEILYEVALRRFLAGDPLKDPYERGMVNGSILALARLQTVFEERGEMPRSEQSIFAIPGTVVFQWRRKLSDPFWRGVGDKMDDAFEVVGTRLINLSGAIQIRTGAAPFPPIQVGSGMVIMGGM
jgi:hypothetical protein